jgi:hypothetical protein
MAVPHRSAATAWNRQNIASARDPGRGAVATRPTPLFHPSSKLGIEPLSMGVGRAAAKNSARHGCSLLLIASRSRAAIGRNTFFCVSPRPWIAVSHHGPRVRDSFKVNLRVNPSQLKGRYVVALRGAVKRVVTPPNVIATSFLR